MGCVPKFAQNSAQAGYSIFDCIANAIGLMVPIEVIEYSGTKEMLNTMDIFSFSAIAHNMIVKNLLPNTRHYQSTPHSSLDARRHTGLIDGTRASFIGTRAS